MFPPSKSTSLKLGDMDLYSKVTLAIVSFPPNLPTDGHPLAMLLSTTTIHDCTSTPRLANRFTSAPPRIPKRIAVIPFILLFHASSILAHPGPVPSNTSMYLSTLADSVTTSPTTSVGQNDAGELQKKSYYLNIAGAIFTALSLFLSFVTTIIAVLDFRLRRKDRTEARRQGIIGEPRNPINDEAGRQARDALAQKVQPEASDAAAGVGLVILAAANGVDADIPPASMPTKRPSRNSNSQFGTPTLQVEDRNNCIQRPKKIEKQPYES
ncbi:hypothetical protein M434DRAFT_392196 [Hypoxylon sp. CO27-5]|nr:hypothetical protein M434DRAFT_392196 [Hypoxylon sp. CO27-5]